MFHLNDEMLMVIVKKKQKNPKTKSVQLYIFTMCPCLHALILHISVFKSLNKTDSEDM